MKIDFSKWIIVPLDTYNVSIENPSEGVKIACGLSYESSKLDNYDDPLKFIKDHAKRQILLYYINSQLIYHTGKSISVEDNLDYVEKEAERRGLV